MYYATCLVKPSALCVTLGCSPIFKQGQWTGFWVGLHRARERCIGQRGGGANWIAATVRRVCTGKTTGEVGQALCVLGLAGPTEERPQTTLWLTALGLPGHHRPSPVDHTGSQGPLVDSQRHLIYCTLLIHCTLLYPVFYWPSSVVCASCACLFVYKIGRFPV